MEVKEQIEIFTRFIEKFYLHKLRERKDAKSLVIDTSKLLKYNVLLCEDLLDNAEETIKAFEIAIQNLNVDLPEGFRIRFVNLPLTQKILIGELRSIHIDKFSCVEGVIRQKSDVRPRVNFMRFECPTCGNIITVLQLDKKLKEPTRCGCGRKGKFRSISKNLVDTQMMVLEELPEELEGEQPRKIRLLLEGDLTSPFEDKRTNPGSRIRVSGILKEVPITLRDGSQSTTYDFIMNVNSLEHLEEDFTTAKISKEEVEEIKKLSKDPDLMLKLIQSIIPSMYGNERIKEAIILQLAGGVRKVRQDESISRGDLHILLVGDPGVAKSQTLKRTCKIAPKGRFVSGKGISGVGVTAAVIKDEMTGGWAVQAGALVLANKGVVCIDELDKMDSDDRDAMHESMEGQTVSIAKAGITATLKCETTILAAANPKLGRFDPFEVLPKQINLPPTLINRFDLIFILKDVPNKETDEKLTDFILELHDKPKEITSPIPSSLLRKYFAYIRQNIKPSMTEKARKSIKDYFLNMRSTNSEGETVQIIPISARQLEALIRLSEACAKIRLDSEIIEDDANRAIDLMNYCLNQVGVDPETGKVDIDRIQLGISHSKREKTVKVREIIKNVDEIEFSQLMGKAEEAGVSESELDEIIEKLKFSGDIYEPKRNFFRKMG